MKVKELRELRDLIYSIYYEGVDPIELYNKTGMEDFMEQLYPSDPNKLFGDWIIKNFDTKFFIKEDRLEKEIKELGSLLNSVRFYSNLPTGGKHLEEIFNELEESYRQINREI